MPTTLKPRAQKRKTPLSLPNEAVEKLPRIQKYLAAHGVGSRREIETWILAERIKVNGAVATLGAQVSPQDKITIDGKPFKVHVPRSLQAKGATRVLVYHKSAAELCTRKDPEGRPTVFENLPRFSGGRWVMVGRLDCNTSGLLLFTNNGELAHRLMHPTYQIEREYAVRILGTVPAEILRSLQKGVELEDGLAKFEQIKIIGGAGVNQWYHVVLKEGRNREVRRLWESQNLQVTRLIRIRYAFVGLPRFLRLGKSIDLEPSVVQKLLALVGMHSD